jgi:putative endonuclease
MFNGKSRNKVTGNLGESLACRFLEERGHRILERNLHLGGAELDIVSESLGTIHLVEVKTISRESIADSESYRPEELVHRGKVNKIWSFGQQYLISREMGDREAQIDVVAVELDTARKVASCRLIEHVEEIL